jgi:DNA-binding MarR family transcriptional regulator
VVAFPGHRPTEAQLLSILTILANTGPKSVRHLKTETGLTEDLLIRCVERLADAGLLTAEDRKDGNDLRLIVSATDAGRRLLAASVEDEAASNKSSGHEELG